MDWIPLASTGFGAAIALGGTMLADHLRRTDERDREGMSARRQSYLDFVLAAGAALQGLREVASSDLTGDDRDRAALAAVHDAAVYPARERFLMMAPAAVVRPGSAAFDGLIVVRDAVRTGAALKSAAYHDVYHPYSELMWKLRLAMRADVGARGLTADDVGRSGWDDRADCRVCVAGPVPAVTAPVQVAAT